mmetsp:Transcript_21124/g.64348  ORF Transcript_21124/g.64348 Transcript_21124/m.64348 type:complete len:80 (-) Transcript_21124:283-522(-)
MPPKEDRSGFPDVIRKSSLGYRLGYAVVNAVVFTALWHMPRSKLRVEGGGAHLDNCLTLVSLMTAAALAFLLVQAWISG